MVLTNFCGGVFRLYVTNFKYGAPCFLRQSFGRFALVKFFLKRGSFRRAIIRAVVLGHAVRSRYLEVQQHAIISFCSFGWSTLIVLERVERFCSSEGDSFFFIRRLRGFQGRLNRAGVSMGHVATFSYVLASDKDNVRLHYGLQRDWVASLSLALRYFRLRLVDGDFFA